MCEVQDVRCVHVMEHANYAETLRVGCICAGHMEENLVGARLREGAFKARRSRRDRWLSRSWGVSRAGNQYLNADGFNVVVYPVRDGLGARIEHRETGLGRALERRYATEKHAKLAAFDAMIDAKAARANNAKRRVIPMIVYRLAPIDFWVGWNHKNDLFREITTEELAYEFRDIEEWNWLWAVASALARRIGWEGDIREGPYVSMLPNAGCDPECSVLIAWKQDNNGTTFIASPYRLPWLEDGYVEFVDGNKTPAQLQRRKFEEAQERQQWLDAQRRTAPARRP